MLQFLVAGNLPCLLEPARQPLIIVINSIYCWCTTQLDLEHNTQRGHEKGNLIRVDICRGTFYFQASMASGSLNTTR